MIPTLILVGLGLGLMPWQWARGIPAIVALSLLIALSLGPACRCTPRRRPVRSREYRPGYPSRPRGAKEGAARGSRRAAHTTPLTIPYHRTCKRFVVWIAHPGEGPRPGPLEDDRASSTDASLYGRRERCELNRVDCPEPPASAWGSARCMEHSKSSAAALS